MERWRGAVQVKDYAVVLWIHERDGVSYRLASGKVEIQHWEKLELDEVSLVLG